MMRSVVYDLKIQDLLLSNTCGFKKFHRPIGSEEASCLATLNCCLIILAMIGVDVIALFCIHT